MQPLTKPEQHNTCDVGVLPTERVRAFRKYLDNHGCQTRDGSGGQHFHVMTLQGWATLTRSRKGRVGTPRWMRPVVDSFLGSSNTAMAPEFWDKFGVTAAGIPRKDAAATLRADLQSEVQRRGIQDQTVAMDPASGHDIAVETIAVIQGEKLLVTSIEKTGAAERRSAQVLPIGAIPAPRQARDSEDAQYLSDLRDDFALHAPLWQQHSESLESFAKRRWAYADAMMKARPASMA
ncbi:hypothetical protein [Pseudomonas sp. PNPG3]|uniref:hypothetical protein n=1 Tax=Pseudomonas sp. PNPG3 TaxID=2919497 RepID=UPI001FFD0B45|nr:hypothetical protein [Pseudomonas sp. PNPG3]MCK2122081.1 hypothetical protein [Pseudomonas sp. PNPG3]